MVADIDTVTQRAYARVGQVLRDKWRLDQVLGMGGMAAVYAATHRNGKRVAIKMLHANLAIGGDSLKRFLREGYVANKVNHPDAVSVLDDDTAEDGSVFVVMELLEGETLERRWERAEQRLPASEVILLADQVLDVLAAAHAHDIVHRDIKPENIFLTIQGATKVLDFGIARLRETEGVSGTSEGTFMGTPAFTPPEQARGEWNKVDARTDIWALGATMFTLLSGRWVHEADTMAMQLITVATKPAPPLGSLAPEVPANVASVVDRALAFDPRDRWPSARDMQIALREAYQVLTGVASPLLAKSDGSLRQAAAPALPSPPRAAQSATAAPVSRGAQISVPMKEAPRTTWLLGGLAVVVVIGGGLFVALRGDPTTAAPSVAVTSQPSSIPASPPSASSAPPSAALPPAAPRRAGADDATAQPPPRPPAAQPKKGPPTPPKAATSAQAPADLLNSRQ
jgi:eukaryotic-like serine/threonine-protein kinase